MPVALVVGERDHKFRAIAVEMAIAIPQAELIVVPGTGHAVHLEDPGRVAEIITQPSWSPLIPVAQPGAESRSVWRDDPSAASGSGSGRPSNSPRVASPQARSGPTAAAACSAAAIPSGPSSVEAR